MVSSGSPASSRAARRGRNPGARLRDVCTPDVAVLVEVVLEAVVLEQLLVVGRVVGVAVEGLELVALDQQAPPVAPLSEVDRAVHRLHAAAGQPHARSVEEHVGHALVLNRLEEAATARGLLLEGRLLAVIEGRDAPHHLARGVAHHPADGLAVGEQVVLRRVEDLADVDIEGQTQLRLPL